jgi:hypothetical protein
LGGEEETTRRRRGRRGVGAGGGARERARALGRRPPRERKAHKKQLLTGRPGDHVLGDRQVAAARAGRGGRGRHRGRHRG